MKYLALFINILVPGVGTMLYNKVVLGLVQLFLIIIAAFMIGTGFLPKVGMVIWFLILFWSVYSILYDKKW